MEEVQQGILLDDLPNELLHMITEYAVDLSDICNLRLTTRRFKDVIDSVGSLCKIYYDGSKSHNSNNSTNKKKKGGAKKGRRFDTKALIKMLENTSIQLKELSLIHTPDITPADLSKILELRGHSLQVLKLEDCAPLSHAVYPRIEDILRKCPNLRGLTLDNGFDDLNHFPEAGTTESIIEELTDALKGRQQSLRLLKTDRIPATMALLKQLSKTVEVIEMYGGHDKRLKKPDGLRPIVIYKGQVCELKKFSGPDRYHWISSAKVRSLLDAKVAEEVIEAWEFEFGSHRVKTEQCELTEVYKDGEETMASVLTSQSEMMDVPLPPSNINTNTNKSKGQLGGVAKEVKKLWKTVKDEENASVVVVVITFESLETKEVVLQTILDAWIVKK